MAGETPYRRFKEESSDQHSEEKRSNNAQEEKSSKKAPVQPQLSGPSSTPEDRQTGVIARNASSDTIPPPGTRRPYRPCVPRM